MRLRKIEQKGRFWNWMVYQFSSFLGRSGRLGLTHGRECVFSDSKLCLDSRFHGRLHGPDKGRKINFSCYINFGTTWMETWTKADRCHQHCVACWHSRSYFKRFVHKSTREEHHNPVVDRGVADKSSWTGQLVEQNINGIWLGSGSWKVYNIPSYLYNSLNWWNTSRTWRRLSIWKPKR